MNISILILAAGKASRMGDAKQLLSYNNTTLLEHAITQASNSKANDVFCVVGANSEEIKKRIILNNQIFIENLNWNAGLSSSIVSGIKHIKTLDKLPDAILIMLADQPFVDSEFLDLLIEQYNKNEEHVIASIYGNNNGVPAIFPKVAFEFLLKLKGDKGAKKLLNSDILKVISVTSLNKNTLMDIDTPTDYKALLGN